MRQHWEELAKADSDLPGLGTEVNEAKIAHSQAEEATARAEQTAEQSRIASDKAAASADQALQAVSSVSEQVAALAAINIPDDLGELSTALAALRTQAGTASRDGRCRGRLRHGQCCAAVRTLGSRTQHR